MVVFLPLASGSKGNSLLIRGPLGAFLIDAGLTRQEMLLRLRAAGHRPEDLDGIVVTHRHLDHVRGVGPLARRYKIPVWASDQTAAHLRVRMLPRLESIHPGLPFDVAGYRLHPVTLSHDAPETLGFLVEAGRQRIGVVTDLGCPGGALLQVLSELDVLHLEFNHDLEMLQNGPYTWSLKQRIAGSQGHLSNRQSAQVLKRLATPRLRRLYLAHLSETNNTPSAATAAALQALDEVRLRAVELRVAAQDEISEGCEL